MIGHTKVPGPLAVLADGFRAELERLGYTPSSREFKLAEVAKLSLPFNLSVRAWP